jgi:hypothetical protein
MTSKRTLLALLAAALVLVGPAAAATPNLAFSFGRKGGSIQPFQVNIYSNGKVSITGAVHVVQPTTVSPDALDALRTLATAERFFSLPPRINCPDVGGLATLYIRAKVGTNDRTVSSYGRCNKRFAGLFEVLQAVAGVSTAPRNP